MPRKRAAISLLAMAAAYLAVFYVAPHIKIKNMNLLLVAGLVTTVIFIAIQIGLVRWLAELRLPLRITLPVMLVSLALFFIGVILIANHQHDKMLHIAKDPKLLHALKTMKPSVANYSGLYVSYRGLLTPIMTLLLITGVSSLGYNISFILRDKNIILPVAAFAGSIDFWTVLIGPTGKMVKQAPEVVQAVSAAIPKVGSGSIAPIAFIGPGDFLFLAMLFGAICRHKMRSGRTFWFLSATLTLGMLGVLLVIPAFPALITVSLGVVLANYDQFNLSKDEVKSVVATAVVLLVLVLAATVVMAR